MQTKYTKHMKWGKGSSSQLWIIYWKMCIVCVKFPQWHTFLILKNAWPVRRQSLPAWCWGPILSSCGVNTMNIMILMLQMSCFHRQAVANIVYIIIILWRSRAGTNVVWWGIKVWYGHSICKEYQCRLHIPTTRLFLPTTYRSHHLPYRPHTDQVTNHIPITYWPHTNHLYQPHTDSSTCSLLPSSNMLCA